MKRISVVTILAAVLVCISQVGIAKKTKKEKQKGTTSVWKISKGDKTIYLGGTIHILRKNDYPLPKAFDIAYNASEVITFETDTKALGDPGLQQKVMDKGMYHDERTLKTVLSEDTYKLLEAECKKYQLPIEMLQKMKPALVVTTLSAVSMKKDMGMTEQGVDMYYTNKAVEDKKELQQLESVDDQINRITSMGEGKEDEFVSYSLKDMKDMESMLTSLIDNWKTGSAVDMSKEITNMKKDYPSIYNSLLVERNNNWMPQIFSYLENGTKAFILVGSLHLHGPDGLLTKLRAQGYEITQL